jgi:hypothetical protein
VKQIFVSIVLSSLWLASIAQHQIGVRMNIGISTISEETSSTKEVQVAPNISGFIGAAYLYNAESTVGFEADLIVTQIRASEIITEDGSFQGCIYCTGLTSITKDYSFTYVAFPVYLKSNTKRFNFGFGLQTGVRVSDIMRYTQVSTIAGQSVLLGPAKREYGLKFIDFGPSLLIDFAVSTKWTMGVNLYSGLLKTPRQFSGDQFYKYQMTLGAKYNFGNKD